MPIPPPVIYFVVWIIFTLTFSITIAFWARRQRKKFGKISGKAKFFIFWITIVILSVGPIIVLKFPVPTPSANTAIKTYYVKSATANIRECPSLSCKIIDHFPQNTPLAYSQEPFNKYPDWAAVTVTSGDRIGYISKTVLSDEEVVVTSQPKGSGIYLPEWTFDPLRVGDSYDISFCDPDSARSGVTCGGLVGAVDSPTGGKPPYSFRKGFGFLPPGMALELNGLLSGAPNMAGTYDFKVCAKDLYGDEGCQDYTLVVNKEGTATGPIPQPPPEPC